MSHTKSYSYSYSLWSSNDLPKSNLVEYDNEHDPDKNPTRRRMLLTVARGGALAALSGVLLRAFVLRPGKESQSNNACASCRFQPQCGGQIAQCTLQRRRRK